MNNKKNIELIVQLLKAHYLNVIVISPGGTNQEFVKAVQDDPFFTCYSVVDERSAMYFAVGLYLQYRKPIVTSCTSAQATRNYIPGLTEAYYKKVPILAITMSKHPRFTYQGYMQAPDQASLPKDCVKKSFVLPCISDDNDVLHATRLINSAILELTRISNGPVQLCVPWLDFPLKTSDIPIKQIKRIAGNSLGALQLTDKKILICIGEHLPFDKTIENEIEQFCEKYDVVIYTNHLSNYHGKYCVFGNLPLLVLNFTDFSEIYKPDILITLGEQTGDYPFYNLFSRNDIQNLEHWRISPDGDAVDTYDKLEIIIQENEYEFFRAMNSRMKMDNQSHHFFKKWNELFHSVNNNVEVPFSAISIAQKLSPRIPKNSVLQLSILNSLRIWNMFDVHPSVECYSNVAAFGIDGGMSTLIGQSVATEKLSFLIIGDLAFLYDINAISIRHIKSNLRILIINNSGGMEFKLWGGNMKSIDKYIAAAGHFRDAKGWAETCGFRYISASSQEELESRIPMFVGNSEKPIVFEAFVKDIDEKTAYSELISHNKNLTFRDKAKLAIKRLIR